MKTNHMILGAIVVVGLALTVELLLTQTLLGQQISPPEFVVAPQTARSGTTQTVSATISSLPNDFPTITVTVPASNTAAGYIFLAPIRWPPSYPNTSYLLIVDNSGQPVYYQRFDYSLAPTGFNFGRQLGNQLVYLDKATGSWQVMDSTYAVTDTWKPTRGSTNYHDLQLLPNGHALLLADEYRSVDMSQVVPGGSPTATVLGFVIQELDQNKNVVFEWDSWSHFQITDTMHVDLTDTLIDYAHPNTLEPDADGNLLVLSRNFDEVTKINRHTGDIMWRLSGKHNEFTFVNDPRGLSRPHDVRRLPNGHLTIFDNGVFHTPQYSRAVEYEIDETQKVITLVKEYRNTPDTFADVMGKAQALPNGNMLVGWGSAHPTVTEFRPDGSKAFELTLAPSMVSYRAYRFVWHARPATSPLLLAQSDGQAATLVLSWNGATDIQSYRVYQGTSPNPVTDIFTVTKTGFETSATLNGLAPGVHYYRFEAVDGLGNASPFSNEAAVSIGIQKNILAKYHPSRIGHE